MQNELDRYIKAVRNVKQKIAPDRRVAIFDVKVSRSGEQIVLKGELGNTKAWNEVKEAIQQAGNPEFIDSITILPEKTCLEQPYAFVRVSVAPLRATPSKSAEMVTQALMGSVLKVLKVKRGWVYVQLTEDNYLGWIDIDQCVRQTQEQLDQWNNEPRVIITAAIDYIRNQPSSTAQSVCDVTAGAVLSGKEYNKEWIAVALPDGRNGYLINTAGMDYQRWKESRNPVQENIEKTARSFLGVPYLWGGTSPKGFDCSGFTKTVYKMNGITLQRDADQQGLAGENVPLEKNMDQLQKGDLLFFCAKPFSGIEKRITHVAIYMGKKEFIHCSGRVKFNSFDPSSPLFSENLLQRLIKVKRVLPNK